MANITTEHRMIDGTGRAQIKITGTLDGVSGQINQTVIDVSTLAFASNANGKIMVSNTHPKQSYGVTLKRILADISGTGYVTLAYQNTVANTPIIMMSPGYKEVDFDFLGGALSNPETVAANTNGDIVLSTLGMGANSAFTILLDMKKSPADYLIPSSDYQ
jgi:hypothetical protein